MSGCSSTNASEGFVETTVPSVGRSRLNSNVDYFYYYSERCVESIDDASSTMI